MTRIHLGLLNRNRLLIISAIFYRVTPHFKWRSNEVNPIRGSPSKTSTLNHPGDKPDPPLLKIIMVGIGGVGKSALTLQFMYDEVGTI